MSIKKNVIDKTSKFKLNFFNYVYLMTLIHIIIFINFDLEKLFLFLRIRFLPKSLGYFRLDLDKLS
jgi:hypothetical protein